MSADTVRSHGAHLLRIVIGLVALSAFAAFAIQAWFAYGFARYVWTLPGPLSFAVPVANDVYIVTLMVVSYLLRTAELRVRIYVWCVLALGIGAQIGAAWSFEHWRSTGAHVGVSFASLVPAALLAAALHSLIIAARHLGTDGQGREDDPVPFTPAELIASAAEPAPSTPAEQAAGAAPVTARPARPAKTPAAPKQASQRGDIHAVIEVRSLVAGGMSCKDAAAKLGRSKRWAEGHTKDIRAALDVAQRELALDEMQPPATAADPALSPREIGPPSVQLEPGIARDQASIDQ